MKTRAAVLEELHKPLAIWELDLPHLGRGQVLVQMVYSGVCRSQLNEIHGFKGEDRYLPHTLGHEGSGIVLEVGEGVSKVQEGDHVVLSWIKGSGLEAPGCRYRCRERVVNSGAISTFIQHAVVAENRLVPIPRELPFKEAALLGCALPTGAGVVFNQMRLQPGQTFAVFGAGGVGLCAILGARSLGASAIIAIDVHDQKLEKAKEVGATHVIHAAQTDPVQLIQEWTDGKGVDCVLECVGVQKAMETAFQVTSTQGICVMAGNLPAGHKIQIDPFDLIKGKRIIGSWGGATDIDRDVSRYVDLYLQQALPLAPLVTHEVDLDGINGLLEELQSGKVGRGVIALKE